MTKLRSLIDNHNFKLPAVLAVASVCKMTALTKFSIISEKSCQVHVYV